LCKIIIKKKKREILTVGYLKNFNCQKNKSNKKSKSKKKVLIVNISTFDPVDEELAPLSFPVCSFFQDKFNSLTSLPECRNVFEVLRK